MLDILKYAVICNKQMYKNVLWLIKSQNGNVVIRSLSSNYINALIKSKLSGI